MTIGAPRLLPLAILAMTALAVVKATTLVQAATPDAHADAPMAAPVTAPVAATPPAEAATPPEPPVGDSERALLLDLRKRRTALDARDAALAARENLLAATTARLATRMGELDDLQKRLEALEAARHGRDEAGWRGLVRTYETMKPKDAAVIFNDLDMPVLLQVVDRMREAKAAPVLAAMLPDRARALTAELARLRSAANAAPPPTPDPSSPSKGVP